MVNVWIGCSWQKWLDLKSNGIQYYRTFEAWNVGFLQFYGHFWEETFKTFVNNKIHFALLQI